MEPWQLKQIEALKKILDQSIIYADIGACRGEMLHFLHSQCQYGYAFEPDSDNFNFLKQYFNYPSIQLINNVVSDISGPIKFYSHHTHMGNILGYNMDHEPFYDHTYVDSITLDEFFLNKPIDFIKLDVEGAEWKVLNGAQQLLKNRNIIWQIEFHLDEDWKNRSMLYDYGYNIYDLDLHCLPSDHPRIYQAIVSKNKPI